MLRNSIIQQQGSFQLLDLGKQLADTEGPLTAHDTWTNYITQSMSTKGDATNEGNKLRI